MKVTVIGGANLDIHGIPDSVLMARTSNPGKIVYSFGGVGRNIAENLARLQVKVSLITCIGDDSFGTLLYQDALQCGIDIKGSCIISNGNTSTYLAIQDECHEMQLAISDMEILKTLTPSRLEPLLKEINQSELVVLDTNLDEEIIGWLMNSITCPIYIDTISVVKSIKVAPFLSKIHTLKPNRYEAEELVGFPLITLKDVIKAGDYFLNLGVKRIVITLGEAGAYAKEGNEALFFKTSPQEVKSATGAGDAFMAGLIYQALHHQSLHHILEFASSCSLIALSSMETVAKNMSVEAVKSVMSTLEYKEEIL